MSNMIQSSGNGDWIRHLNSRFDEHQRWLLEQLNYKADKEDVDKLESKIEKVENRTNKLAVKQAGIAGSVAIVLGYFKFLITGNW